MVSYNAPFPITIDSISKNRDFPFVLKKLKFEFTNVEDDATPLLRLVQFKKIKIFLFFVEKLRIGYRESYVSDSVSENIFLLKRLFYLPHINI